MPLRTTKIYNTDNIKCWQGRGVTGVLTPSWWVERMLVETI